MRLFLLCLSVCTWNAVIFGETAPIGGVDATARLHATVTDSIPELPSPDAQPMEDRRVALRALAAGVDLSAIVMSLRLRMIGIALPSEIPRTAFRDLLARLGQDFGREPAWWRNR